MSKTTTLAKPTLGGKTTSAAALAFAEAGAAPEKQAQNRRRLRSGHSLHQRAIGG